MKQFCLMMVVSVALVSQSALMAAPRHQRPAERDSVSTLQTQTIASICSSTQMQHSGCCICGGCIYGCATGCAACALSAAYPTIIFASSPFVAFPQLALSRRPGLNLRLFRPPIRLYS